MDGKAPRVRRPARRRRTSDTAYQIEDWINSLEEFSQLTDQEIDDIMRLAANDDDEADA